MRKSNISSTVEEFAIVAKNLCKTFSGNALNHCWGKILGVDLNCKDDFKAISDISFKVKKGESVGILGENGAGKSTLLQIIASTLTPNSGSVTTEGRLAALLELGSGFNPEFSGIENIYLNASILGLRRSTIDSVLNDILEFAQIGEFAKKPVKTYSSGMTVRLAFAVSIFVYPDILIIDEALAVGDLFFRKKCYEVLRKFSQEGGTLLFVSHNEDQLRLFANRVIVLFEGKIIFDGEANEAIALYNEKIGVSRREYFSALSTKNIDKRLYHKKNLNTHITKVQVFNDKDVESNLFSYGETVKINVYALVTDYFDCLHFGILIRNKEGINIYSTETEAFNISKLVDLSNDNNLLFTSSFEFTFPIGKNSYSVEAYIIDRENKTSNRIDWITNAAFFNFAYPLPYKKSYFKGGVVDLNANKNIFWTQIKGE